MHDIVRSLAAAALLLLLPQVVSAQELFKEITSQGLEDLLKSMDINFKKGDAGKGITYYDYRKSEKEATLRLWNYTGKDLMIDALLPKVPWEVVNKWNSLAKFSRAHLRKNDKEEIAVLESNLDLSGGVTVDTIKRFINRFDEELLRWNNKPVLTANGGAEEDIFTTVSAERLEKVIKGLMIDFKKNQNNNSSFYYFQRNGYNVRVSNYGGTDLMINANFPPATLVKINAWNSKRNCVRAVLYEENGKQFTALESNLDCVGGTTESTIRWFIEAFDEEVKAFDAHLSK